jgi:predicted DNA-binding protein
MATLQIPDELESLIELGMQHTGESRDVFLREAVRSRLEEIEDIALATERLKNPGKHISLDEIGRKYGLTD